MSEATLSAIISLKTNTHQLCIPLGTTLELLRLLLRRYKLCIPLGMSLELLRLLLRRYKLCIPLGTSLELLCLLLSAESALTFRCELCIPLGTSLELLHLFSFGTRWCVLSFYIYIFGGFCSYKTKKEITDDGPIKNLSPPLERKRVP
jgi:hypothetical protein